MEFSLKELLNLTFKKLKYNFNEEEDEQIKKMIKKIKLENYREKCNLNKKEWRKNNKEYLKKYNNSYYNKNKDKQLENIKIY